MSAGIDVSELWIPAIALLVALAMAGTFVIGGRIGRNWWRIPVRITASAGMLLSTLFLVLLLFSLYSCTGHVPVVHSSKRKYVAVVTFGLQGALGLDIADVSVRNWWSPHGNSVYTGPGDWGLPYGRKSDPEVRWIDNNHLMIRYHDYGNDYVQTCKQRVKDIQITCVRLPPTAAK